MKMDIGGKAVLNIAPAFAGWRLTPDPAYKPTLSSNDAISVGQQNPLPGMAQALLANKTRTTRDGTSSVGPRKQAPPGNARRSRFANSLRFRYEDGHWGQSGFEHRARVLPGGG
jgi:hypothetical protein